MTSTGTCAGMDNIDKPTSRVLEPPGGKTSFSLGGYGEDPAPAARKSTAADADADKQRDLYKPSPPQPIRPAEAGYANLFGDEIIQIQADNLPRGKRRFPDQTDIGHNPVTGKPNMGGPTEVQAAAPEAAVDPSVAKGQRAKPVKMDPASMPAAGGRVEDRNPVKRQPPGGKDSGIFSQ